MPAERERHFRRYSGIWLLLTGVLAPPLVFLLSLQLKYSLNSWACPTANPWLHLVAAAALLLSVGAGYISWRAWQETGRDWPDEEAGTIPRSRFLAVTGLLTSALFALVLIAQWLPGFIFDPCQR